MFGDYAALAKAVRPTMRRWWRRVGAWWVAAIVAGTLGANLTNLERLLFGTHASLAQPLMSGVLVSCGVILIIAGPLILWVAAAWAVIRAVEGLFAGFPHPRPGPLLRSVYALVCLQGVIPLALCVAYYTVLILLSGLARPATQPSLAMSEYMLTTQALSVGLTGLWVLAVLVTAPIRPLFIWCWVGALFLPFVVEPVRTGIYIALHIYVPTWQSQAQGLAPPWDGVAWGLGGVIMIALLVAGRRGEARPVQALVLVMILSALAVGLGDHLGMDVAFLGGITRFLTWPPFVFKGPAGPVAVGSLTLQPALRMPVSLVLPLPPWGAYLIPLFNLLWLALVFIAIAAILSSVRGPQPERQ